jgi:hypothetical protein
VWDESWSYRPITVSFGAMLTGLIESQLCFGALDIFRAGKLYRLVLPFDSFVEVAKLGIGRRERCRPEPETR